MLSESQLRILLVTRDRALAASIESVLKGSAAQTTIGQSWTPDDSLAEPMPALLLLDAELPETDIDRILASMRTVAPLHACRIVLISDSITDAWNRRLAEGTLDDLIPRDPSNPHWRARLDYVLRASQRLGKLDRWHDASQFFEQLDPLTGLFNRSALMAALFRETDRVQRSRHALSVALFEVDDFDHWTSRFASQACRTLLRGVAERVSQMLRSYDILGRSDDHQFLLILPGCSALNANLLSERLHEEVFATPISVDGEAIRLSACFGIASSEGRSPVVVLREAEFALRHAQEIGPDSIQTFARSADAELEPIQFLS